jgi:hypothetical protein
MSPPDDQEGVHGAQNWLVFGCLIGRQEATQERFVYFTECIYGIISLCSVLACVRARGMGGARGRPRRAAAYYFNVRMHILLLL